MDLMDLMDLRWDTSVEAVEFLIRFSAFRTEQRTNSVYLSRHPNRIEAMN